MCEPNKIHIYILIRETKMRAQDGSDKMRAQDGSDKIRHTATMKNRTHYNGVIRDGKT